MRLTIVLAFIGFHFFGFCHKHKELIVSVKNVTGEALSGITVEFRNSENHVLFLKVTTDDGRVSYLPSTKEDVLINVYDSTWTYEPQSDYHSKKRKQYAFNFNLSPISKEISDRLIVHPELFPALKDWDLMVCEGVVHQDASFVGGSEAQSKYTAENINFPSIASLYNIGGRIFTKFWVDENGYITKIKISRGVDGCKECDYEVLKLLANMPQWIPATCDGKNVPSFIIIPVNFIP